jgi:hypothetical protein
LIRRPVASAVLAVAALSLLSACGGSKEDDFAKDYRDVNKQIVALGSDVGKTVNGASKKTDKELADEFGSLSKRTGDLAKDVDDLEPPDDLQKTTDDLSKSLTDAQHSLADIQDAADKHDADAARKATIQLVTSSADLRDARRKLEKATR